MNSRGPRTLVVGQPATSNTQLDQLADRNVIQIAAVISYRVTSVDCATSQPLTLSVTLHCACDCTMG